MHNSSRRLTHRPPHPSADAALVKLFGARLCTSSGVPSKICSGAGWSTGGLSLPVACRRLRIAPPTGHWTLDKPLTLMVPSLHVACRLPRVGVSCPDDGASFHQTVREQQTAAQPCQREPPAAALSLDSMQRHLRRCRPPRAPACSAHFTFVFIPSPVYKKRK